jgi:AcrR family transcriptional regulator
MFLNLESNKQQRIVDAAVDEFAGKGYARASMNVVVERAGISKGALFKYFQSKSGLFAFVYRMAFNQVKDYLRAVRDENRDRPFFERLEKVVRAGTDFIRRHPGLARIYYHIRLTGDAPASRAILQELELESLNFIQSLVEEARERGELRRDFDPRVAAFLIECILDRFLYIQFLDLSPTGPREGASPPSRWIPEIIDLVKRGMAALPSHDRRERQGSQG